LHHESRGADCPTREGGSHLIERAGVHIRDPARVHRACCSMHSAYQLSPPVTRENTAPIERPPVTTYWPLRDHSRPTGSPPARLVTHRPLRDHQKTIDRPPDDP